MILMNLCNKIHYLSGCNGEQSASSMPPEGVCGLPRYICEWVGEESRYFCVIRSVGNPRNNEVYRKPDCIIWGRQFVAWGNENHRMK